MDWGSWDLRSKDELKARIKQLEEENKLLEKALDQSMDLNKKYNNIEVALQKLKKQRSKDMSQREDIKEYAKHAMTAIISNNSLFDSLITSRKKNTKPEKFDAGTIADEVAAIAHMFALALCKEIKE